MTDEGRKKLVRWASRLVMVISFVGMGFALDHMLRSYRWEDVAAAMSETRLAVVLGALGLQAVRYALFAWREWLAVVYAGKADIGFGRTLQVTVIARFLDSLGVSAVTGVGLRLRLYSAWGLTPRDVGVISTYHQGSEIVGLAARIGFPFLLLPIPSLVAAHLGHTGARAIGVVSVLLLVAYLVWSRRAPAEVRIRSLVFPVPRGGQAIAQVVLPLFDLLLAAAILFIFLPAGIGVTYSDAVFMYLIASAAVSVAQVPAGLGILEGTVLLMVGPTEARPAILGGLLARRIVTDLVPIVIGAVLLVAFDVRHRRRLAVPEWLAETTATVLAGLTFVVGVILMVLSVAPTPTTGAAVPRWLGLAAGTGLLLVSRGLQLRSRHAWRIALILLVLRAAVAVALRLPLVVIAGLLVEGTLLALSRNVFEEPRAAVVDASVGWWLGFGMAISGTVWVAFVGAGRELTEPVAISAGIMLGVASLAAASAVTRARARRSRGSTAPAPGSA